MNRATGLPLVRGVADSGKLTPGVKIQKALTIAPDGFVGRPTRPVLSW